MMVKALCLLLVSVAAVAAPQLTEITVNGDADAQIHLQTNTAWKGEPSVQIKENVVEVTFSGMELAEKLSGKFEISNPHALLQSVSAASYGANSVRAKFIVNGSPENLRSRLKGRNDANGIHYSLSFPDASQSTISLMKEEQLPVLSEKKSVKEASGVLSWKQIFVMLIVVSLAGVCTFFFLRFLKSQGQIKGSRKYLIEQLAYASTGPKTGVSLMRVGKEFVLLGVTPSAVTFLSSLPKLQEEYEESSKFERGVFHEAVEKEFERLKRPTIQS